MEHRDLIHAYIPIIDLYDTVITAHEGKGYDNDMVNELCDIRYSLLKLNIKTLKMGRL